MIITTYFLVLLLGIGVVSAHAQTLDDYSSLPPFVSGAVTPNVLLMVDNSGSMNHCAYADTGVDGCLSASGVDLSDGYVSTDPYYGYFESDKCYNYAASKFSSIGSRPCSNSWDGNFLNWLTMRRIDITKWVMTGGQCNAVRSSENSCSTLRGQTSFNAGACCQIFYKQFNLTGVAPSTYTTTRCIRVQGGNFYVRLNGKSCGSNTIDDEGSFFIRVDAGVKQTGVIQEVGNKARFGLMAFDDDGTMENGAEIRSDIGGNMVTLVNAIEGMVATSWTPLAESTYEAARYFAQIPPTPDTGTANYMVSVNNDAYCYADLNPPAGETGCKTATQGRWVPCCKSFVILFTDGQPTQDRAIPTALQDYAHTATSHGTSDHCAAAGGCTALHTSALHPTLNDHHDVCSNYYSGETNDSCKSAGSHYLDDVAYWAHTTDLRPSTGNIAGINEIPNINRLSDVQSLNIYTFFAFGNNSKLLKDAAKAGGFDDLDGDMKPFSDATCGTASPNSLCREWDKNGNGVPDNYYESANAYTLRDSLVAVITDILQKSASGTSVSVLATSSGGEGAIYQAYFYPSVFETAGEASWLGYLQGLFFDSNGQLREDTPIAGAQDRRLVLSQDRIVETFFDTTLRETRVRRYDVDLNGDKTGTPTTISLTELSPIWEGGKVLAKRDLSLSPRTIKTWVDANNDGIVATTEFIDFAASNVATLRPYLRAADVTEGTNVINFINGTDITGYRSRQVTVDGVVRTWRLGDVIYSSPVSVGAPQERFDLKYQDTSYTAFYEKHKNRRHVVYVGANDGMLHAFNSGFFTAGDDPATGSTVEHGWFTTDSKGFGEELWGFIPQELLPHLKWLTDPAYDKNKHVYFVDGSPRVTDAQIFTEEAACATSLTSAGCIHPGGWGTVLIGNMRLGGGLIKVDLNGNGLTTDAGEDRFRSAYFALDITNPEATPTLLWVYKESDLGFTTGWPAVMRFNTSTGSAWYTVFGSGPLTYKGERDAASATNKFASTASEYGKIYVINLKTGALVTKMATDSTDRYAFMGDPVVYDLPRNNVSDIFYIGKTYYSAGAWVGKMLRLVTYGSDDPINWKLSVLLDPQKPVLVKATATKDKAGRLWIYFGTGRYFSSGTTSDQTDTSAQAMYAVKETSANGCWNNTTGDWKAICPTIAAADLLDVTNVSVAVGGAVTCTSCGATTLSGLADNVINSTTAEKAGWVINLTGGERVLHESTILGGIVAGTTFKPGSNVCAPQGTNALYAMYYETGTAFSASVIGVTGTTVDRKKDLGVGVASKVNVVVSDSTVTGFVQSSTGEIVQIKGINLASSVRSGGRVFREKAD